MNKRARSNLVSPRAERSNVEAEVEEPPGPDRRPRNALRTNAAGPTTGMLEAVSSRPAAPASVPQSQLTFDWPISLPPRIEHRRIRRAPELRQLGVVVLHSLALGLERGREIDRLADEETARVAQAVAEALQGHVRDARPVPVWDDLRSALGQFDPAEYAVFNLCESLGGRPFTEPEAPRELQSAGFVFTGAPYTALRRAANKREAKRRMIQAGLPTPRFHFIRRPSEIPVDVSLPAVVKPVEEGGSFGITQDSVVTQRAALEARVVETLETYRQPVLVEEYIAGREINVAIWGNRRPQVLPISEIVFEWTDDPLRQLVTFESKWVEDSVEYRGTPAVCPARLEPDERATIEAAGLEAYRLLGMRGYARVDMRFRDGIPYILEVNANPDLAPDAGFFRSASAAGFSYAGMVLHILRLALASQPWPKYVRRSVGMPTRSSG
jgi:D-alanine-D-alanine ligase